MAFRESYSYNQRKENFQLHFGISLKLDLLSQYWFTQYLFNLTIQIMYSSDQKSILNTFLTPQGSYRQTNNLQSIKNNRTSMKRTPIFSTPKNRRSLADSLPINLNKTYYKFLTNVVQPKVIHYDFCGCENKTTPCDIVVMNFLDNVSLKQMKNSYMQDFEKMENMRQSVDFHHKKILFKILPKSYPQIFLSQLNNLVQVIGVSKLNQSQFRCVFHLLYHCKLEYLSFFLYRDMKKSYSNKEKFYIDLQKELARLNTNFRQLKYVYNQNSLVPILEKFINDYYDSIGANLVPIYCYAKFISNIYLKGNKFFVKFLTDFMVIRCQELKNGLKMLRIQQNEGYNNVMGELNFFGYFEQALKQQV